MFIPVVVTKMKHRFNRRMMMQIALVVGISILLAACSSQPGTTSSPSPTATTSQAAANPKAPAANAPTVTSGGSSSASVSFSKDVEPIFQSRCVTCHGGPNPQRGLNLSTYASVMAGSANGPVVVPGNPDSSRLIQMVTQGLMPKSGPKLLPSQIQILTEWVQAGALNN
ncbi:MAG: c-type cytochrome domain-containing protein [Anaerolineales bacterium]|jgi:mono/diheme cytochrome c family protein